MGSHRPMRRDDRAMTPEETEQLLRQGVVAHLATTSEDGWPYVIPVNYVYEDGVFIIHSARDGHKIDNIRADSRVCVEVSQMLAIVETERACDFSVHYRSAVAFGRARIVNGEDSVRYLSRLASAFAGGRVAVSAGEAARVAVIVIDVERVTGKQSGT